MKTTVLAVALATASAALCAPAASAQLYVGGGYTAFKSKVENSDVDLGAVMGRVGYEFSPVLAVEGEAAVGVKDDSVNAFGTNIDVSINHEIAGFVVGKLPLLGVDLFGRVGYASFSADAGNDDAPDGGGLAFGAGVNFNVLALRLRAEYTRYQADIDDYDSLGLSALLKF